MARLPRAYYEDLERRLKLILARLSMPLDGFGAEYIEDYIEHGEYGLALDTLSGFLAEGEHKISRSTFELMEDAATIMGIYKEVASDELRRCIDETV